VHRYRHARRFINHPVTHSTSGPAAPPGPPTPRSLPVQAKHLPQSALLPDTGAPFVRACPLRIAEKNLAQFFSERPLRKSRARCPIGGHPGKTRQIFLGGIHLHRWGAMGGLAVTLGVGGVPRSPPNDGRGTRPATARFGPTSCPPNRDSGPLARQHQDEGRRRTWQGVLLKLQVQKTGERLCRKVVQGPKITVTWKTLTSSVAWGLALVDSNHH
jgi:hypothetical protein